jgi:hypothetical protein
LCCCLQLEGAASNEDNRSDSAARLQSRLPDALIRRLVAVLVLAIGIYYHWSSGLA